jgi:large subunit ribosomal protein L35
MPKLKSHRGAAKRFSLTGTGKIKRSKAYASHILTKKTRKRKRSMRKTNMLHKSDMAGIKKLIPYA